LGTAIPSLLFSVRTLPYLILCHFSEGFLDSDLKAQFLAAQDRFTQIPTVPIAPIVLPTHTSFTKRTASATETPDENQPSSSKSHRTTDIAIAGSKGYAFRRAFCEEFSPKNWKLTPIRAIEEFNKTVPEEKQLKPDTPDHEKCRQMHNNLRYRLRHRIQAENKPTSKELKRYYHAERAKGEDSPELWAFSHIFSRSHLHLTGQKAVMEFNRIRESKGQSILKAGTPDYTTAMRRHKVRKNRESKLNDGQLS
jgi:hypothetical protein